MKNFPKTIFTVLAAGLASSALFTQEAQAAKIVGTIGLEGAARFGTRIFNATQVVEWRGPDIGFTRVGYTTGDFSGIPLFTEAAMSAPWTFNPSTATPSLWSVGGFKFDLLSSTIFVQNTSELIVLGSGIVSGNGFDPTPAFFAFAAANVGGEFSSISAFTIALAPDGGSTVALLGMGLGVIEFIRRKLRCPCLKCRISTNFA